MIISTLLGLSEGGNNEERLGCSQEKGEIESEGCLVSSNVSSKGAKESTNLECKAYCNVICNTRITTQLTDIDSN